MNDNEEINISDDEFIRRLKKAASKEGKIKIKRKMSDEKYKTLIKEVRKVLSMTNERKIK